MDRKWLLGDPESFLETWGGFGKWGDFWKVPGLLETMVGFGNPGGFWKPEGNLETHEWNF